LFKPRVEKIFIMFCFFGFLCQRTNFNKKKIITIVNKNENNMKIKMCRVSARQLYNESYFSKIKFFVILLQKLKTGQLLFVW
jgi:hypothetical protein